MPYVSILPAHCNFPSAFLHFFCLEQDLQVVKAQNHSQQKHAVKLKIHQETVIIAHMSAVAIHSKEPPEDAQFACIHQLQLLAELFALKLCCSVEMWSEGQEVVMWNFIFSLVTTIASIVTQILILRLETILLIIGYKIKSLNFQTLQTQIFVYCMSTCLYLL